MTERTRQSGESLHFTSAEKTVQSSGIIKNTLLAFRTVCIGLVHGIPLELAFTVDPTTKKALMKEFYARTEGQAVIKKKVSVMLELLDRYFPNLVKHSTQWMSVRAHFFGEIGLWGKTG